jgi:hypothetical protein
MKTNRKLAWCDSKDVIIRALRCPKLLSTSARVRAQHRCSKKRSRRGGACTKVARGLRLSFSYIAMQSDTRLVDVMAPVATEFHR